MKRLHVSIGVEDLDTNLAFYTTLFGTPPTKQKPDYAQWMLDDPRVNFVLDGRVKDRGVGHLGIQVDSADELTEIADRLEAADRSVFSQKDAACCYARSDKAWSRDPQGVPWESFFTFGQEATYGTDVTLTVPAETRKADSSASCCVAEG